MDWNIYICRDTPITYSHTLRGCVDWNRNGQRYCYYGKVTPCVGVWIETPYRENISHYFRSHPAWVCGLKLIVVVRHCLFFWSHPAWGCVDWNTEQDLIDYYIPSHTLRGCVDWNIGMVVVYHVFKGHTLRGCVDWNQIEVETLTISEVTPCVGVWIETEIDLNEYLQKKSHTLRGCVDWNRHVWWILRWRFVTPCVGVWIETKTRNLWIVTFLSHPAWVCGLKLTLVLIPVVLCVTPCVGVWIETNKRALSFLVLSVTPCVGVWIETPIS